MAIPIKPESSESGQNSGNGSGSGGASRQNQINSNEENQAREASDNRENEAANADRNHNERERGVNVPIDTADDCPICLQPNTNAAYPNRCLHEFCLPCLLEWSMQNNTCAICRQTYTMIFCNIRPDNTYDVIAVPPDGVIDGFLLTNGYWGVLLTPQHSGIYVVYPILTPYGISFNWLFMGPNQLFLLTDMVPDLVIARPRYLRNAMIHLENHLATPVTNRNRHQSRFRHQNGSHLPEFYRF